MRISRLPRVRRVLRAALVASSALAFVTCAEDPIGPAAGEARLQLVPVYANSMVPPLTIDAVRVQVLRADSVAEQLVPVYDDTVAFSPDRNTLRLPDIRIRMSQPTEDVEVVVQLLAGSLVMFQASQPVTLVRGSSTQPAQAVLTYVGPGANVASLVLGPRDTTIAPGSAIDMRLDAFDSAGAAVPQYYASWSLAGGPAAGARVNAAGHLTAPSGADTFYVKVVNIPTGSTDSTRVIVGQAAPPPPVTATLIAGGDEFTCQIRGTSAYCWGDNGNGQLGDSSFSQRLIPTPVAGGHAFTSITAGLFHACALTATGQAWCWGYGQSGELGDGTSTTSTVPVPVSGGHAFVQLAAGDGYSCGITAAGAGWCWGQNFTGSLGDGSTTSSPVPVQVTGNRTFVRIAAAGEFDNTANHTCAIDTGGTAFCWGDNGDGQLGDSTFTGRTSPVAVSGGLRFSEIAAGGTSACGVTTGGDLYCWGNLVGQNSPVLVPGGLKFTQVTMGDFFVCGRTAAGWRCAGSNSSGQLGDGTGSASTTPVVPSGGLTFTSLGTGSVHTCGITAAGTYCWGSNSAGQAGVGQPGGLYLVPTKVSGPATRVAVLAGNNQSAPVSSAVANPLSVQVFDAANAPVAGAAVRFEVKTGGGTINGTTVFTEPTDSTGTASVVLWTLGPAAGSNTVSATVESRGVTGNPVTFTATGTQNTPTTITWTGAVDNSWNTAGNWTPRAPTALDNVVIPNLQVSPALQTPTQVAGLTVQAGATLFLSTQVLQATGDVAVDGRIDGFSVGAGVILAGTNKNLHGTINGPTILAGSYKLDGNLNFGTLSTGTFSMAVTTGQLDLNGHTARVVGSIATTGTGTLRMVNALDSLKIENGGADGGDLLLSGGSTTGLLTAGRILLARTLAVGSGSPTAFDPSGTHRVVLTGPVDVTILDSLTSGFADLDLNGQQLVAATALPIRGTLIAGGTSLVAVNGGHRVSAGGVNVSKLAVVGGPVTIGNGTIAKFDSVTFSSTPTTVVQLTVQNNGAATPFTFTGLKFTDTPVAPNGFYLDASDPNGATGGTLTINLVGASPATPGGFVRTTNAVVNWPVVGTVTWTGATSIDWNTASNWNPARIPGAGDSVVIPNAVTNFPTLSGRHTIGGMFEDGRLTINGGTLEVLRGTSSNSGINRIIFLTAVPDSLIIRGDNASPTSGTGGTYVAGGNITVPGNFGAVRLVMNGTGDQFLAGSGLSNVQVGTMTINKPSGNVTTTAGNLFTGDSLALLGGGMSGGGIFQLVGGFFSAPGTTVNLTTGGVTVGTTINAQGSYSAATTTYNLPTTPTPFDLPVLPYVNLTINGVQATTSTARLSTRMVVTGNMTLGGTSRADLVLNGKTLAVGGAVFAGGLGGSRFVMTNALDSLIVAGDATFGAAIGGNPGNLTAGTFLLGGNFVMQTQFGGANFQATGTHTTILTSNNPTVTFYLPGSGTGGNRFQNLVWRGTGTMTLGDTATVVGGTLTTTATTPVTFLGAQAGGSRLQFRSLAASGAVTFNNAPVWAVQTGTGSAIGLGNATFTSMPTTKAQLTVQHPGLATAITLPNLTFSTTPVAPNGFYVSATDNAAADANPLVLNLTTPTPGASGGFTQVAGGAAINWGVIPVTWTGNVSTNWSTAGNWNGGVVPSGTDSVIIPSTTNQPTLTANVSVGAVNVTGGTLALGGRTLTVNRGFSTTGTGTLSANVPASIMLVTGDVLFAGGNTNGLLSAGTLQVAGNFTQSAAGGSVTSFAPSGTFKTVFVSAFPQNVSMGSPGAGAGGSHFQVLDVSSATGGLVLDVNMAADSLISTSPAGKISSSGVRLTARRTQVSGLTLLNTTFVLDEQGAFAAENFSNVSFTGFPTPIAGTTMLTVIGPGSAAAARPAITTANVNFQQMGVGAANFYVDLTSSNGFSVTLDMTTSNQATNNGGNGSQLYKVTPATGVATVTW